jgi:hypothetical protein
MVIIAEQQESSENHVHYRGTARKQRKPWSLSRVSKKAFENHGRYRGTARQQRKPWSSLRFTNSKVQSGHY